MASGANPILLAKATLLGAFKSIAGNIDPQTQEQIINAGQKNTADIAAKFLIAEQARSYWNKQYETVKADAKEKGILGEDSDYIEGETRVVSSFTGFDITAKKAAGSKQVNRTKLENALNKHTTPAKRDLILAECLEDRKGAVTISVSVK